MRPFLEAGNEKTRTAVGLKGLCGPSLRSFPTAKSEKTRTAVGLLGMCGLV